MSLRNVPERELRRLPPRAHSGPTASVERETAAHLTTLWGRNDLPRGEKPGKTPLLTRSCSRYRFRKAFPFKKGLPSVPLRGLASSLSLASLSEPQPNWDGHRVDSFHLYFLEKLGAAPWPSD